MASKEKGAAGGESAISDTVADAVDRMAFDLPRVYANQASAFSNESVTILVFREVADMSGDDRKITRNVASVILPRQTAADLGEILLKHAKIVGEAPVEQAEEDE